MFVIKDMRPLAIVEGEGFRQLMKTAEPRFKLPSRTYFSRVVISTKYAELRTAVEAFLSTVQYCSVTTDLWTSRHQARGFLSLTCHAIDGDWVLRNIVTPKRLSLIIQLKM